MMVEIATRLILQFDIVTSFSTIVTDTNAAQDGYAGIAEQGMARRRMKSDR